MEIKNDAVPHLPLVITGITGCGKTTIANGVGNLSRRARLALHTFPFQDRYTTRILRPGEKEGIDGHFVSENEFDRIISDPILDYRKHGVRYGIRQSDLASALQRGHSIMIGGEEDTSQMLQSAINLRLEFCALEARIIFVRRSIEDILNAIDCRPSTEEEKKQRQQRVVDMYHRMDFNQCHYTVDNTDHLPNTLRTVLQIIETDLHSQLKERFGSSFSLEDYERLKSSLQYVA